MVFSNKNILIVDDEDVQFDIIKTGLKDLGCKFTYATNGREALATIDKEKPDLVITDLIMLEMTGLEMIRTLQEKGQQIPTIVMTGFANVKTIREAQALGVLEFIEKPVRMNETKTLVARILSNTTEDKPNSELQADPEFSLRLHFEEEFYNRMQEYCRKEGLSITTLVKGLLKRKIEGSDDW